MKVNIEYIEIKVRDMLYPVRVVTLKEAAELSGYSYSGLKSKIKRGDLAYIPVGNAKLVPEAEVERLKDLYLFNGSKRI